MLKKEVKILTLDTETYSGLIGKLKKLAIYDGEKVTYGDSFTDIENLLIEYSKIYKLIIYVHNLEFDSRKIPEIWDKKHIKWSGCLTINNKIATIKNKYWEIKDSFKILPLSLRELSKEFNVEHGKLDLWTEVQKIYPNQYTDVVDFLDKCKTDDKLFLKYLGYDVMSLYEIIEKLIQISGVTKNQFTKIVSTSSLSRMIFKQGYKGKVFKSEGQRRTDYQILTQYNWVNDIDTEAILRNAYCGGRTEVFKPILENFGYHFDVNSIYPYWMLEELPVGKPIEYNDSVMIKKIFELWMDKHVGAGFIQCEIYVPYQHIPPLPCNMGKLAFPCGYLKGTWSYIELEYAILYCDVQILNYEICLHFPKTFPIFRNFITTIYSLKKEGTITKNNALRFFAKLLMNCGYGYTGMRRDDKKGIDDIKNISKYTEISYVNKKEGYIEFPSEIKSEYIQVQVAAYITSLARLQLLKTLKYLDSIGNVYYCDTDSIVSDVPLDEKMIDSVRLGMWDLENKLNKGLYLKPKVYIEEIIKNDEIKTLKKFKGVSKTTVNNFDYSTYEEILEEIIYGCEKRITVEENKIMQPSVMVLQRQAKSLDYYEKRDKVINLDNMEKRIMDYKNNITKPYYFKDLDEFINFKFMKVPRGVEFNMIKYNHI